MPAKPIPRMMAMKPMRTTHTEHHQPSLQILFFERLRRALFPRIRAAEPHHAEPAPRHLGMASWTREGGGLESGLGALRGVAGCGGLSGGAGMRG